MPGKESSITKIAIVGGGTFCKELLEKTVLDYKDEAVGRIMAVADPDPETPGMVFAQRLGLKTVQDYKELYRPEYGLHAIILLTPEKSILEDVLRTKPAHVRLISYHVLEFFWNALRVEERRLRERTREMETVLNGIQDFISVITPEREIVDVNEAFLKQMGYSREEVIGRKCHEIFQKGSRPCKHGDIICPVDEAMRNKRPSQQVLTRVDHDGETRYIEETIFPVWGKGDRILRFIDISRDITERKRQEEQITRRLEAMVEERTRQLKETHAKLLHQDKMASLGKLSAAVVHEINNPIAGILNLIMLMKRVIKEGPVNPKEIDRFNQYLELISTETRRISRIVSNLLAFSRESKIRLRELDLNRVIEKTLFLNANLLKINGVRVERHMDPNLPHLIGSEDQLQQVFMNLISNAAEAMEGKSGGKLVIGTEYSSDNGKITVYFKDTGAGIPAKNLSRLFEPFFTTKKKGKGVGLGLSVAYGIIEEHGGSINTDSQAGKGTTFRVELPLKQPSGLPVK